MLTIKIPSAELFDETTEKFIDRKEVVLVLEHSLVSLSKWESKWHRPFLSKGPKSTEETIDYIKCMTLTQNVDDNVYVGLTSDIFKKIDEYIQNPMTATTFSEDSTQKTFSREVITSEIIYSWMIALNIPVEFQKWHLNRLITLIKVCNIKNKPPKKKASPSSFAARTALNEARLKQYATNG